MDLWHQDLFVRSLQARLLPLPMLSWPRMSREFKFATAILNILLLTSFSHGSRIGRKIELDNNGHKIHLTLYATTDTPRSASPTIVFESGLGGGESHWSSVIKQLPDSVPIVTYGRPGLDGSEPDGAVPSPEHIATVLHTALSRTTHPPYLLVGHSWGGLLIRAFAGLFPKETAGLVFIDPTDFNETATCRRDYVFGPLGHGDDGESIRAAIDLYYEKQAGKFDPAVQAEIDASREGRANDFLQLKKLPMPQVPVIIVATTRYPPLNDPNLIVPFDKLRYQNLLLNYRLVSLSSFTRSVTNGTLITTSNSGHYIQEDEPGLVVWAINRALHASIEQRSSAVAHPHSTPSSSP
jgi:pimeloyl-ACP methyl ester carboxylesterase